MLYQTPNLTGALFLIVNTIHYGAYPSTFINLDGCHAAVALTKRRSKGG